MEPTPPQQDELFRAVCKRAADTDADLREHLAISILAAGEAQSDYLYATPIDPHQPQEIFPRLRWGGQFLFASPSRREVRQLADAFAHDGFEITQQPASVCRGWCGLPLLSTRVHYFVARKVELIQPGEMTERFTYYVHLVKHESDGQYIVAKEVPSLELVMGRLKNKWPDLPEETIERRARKFADKIFPTFLTREAAILKIIQRDLPEAYKLRVPRVLDLEQDSRGFVRKMYLNWLRNGGEPLSQVEFARQSADLLRVLHDQVGVMHLDLRLDNFVITEHGVGFVDFGSAVRFEENLSENPLLFSLFEELQRTSEIQRMLGAMTASGQVTSKAIADGHQKVDKAVDFFYLAVQMSAPHGNPDLRGLVKYDPQSLEARALARLTETVLRPKNPERPAYRGAADLLRGIAAIKEMLGAA